ncbi:hypothetical protein DPSP01_003997 [Paraphaeosphaeria sporulosa]
MALYSEGYMEGECACLGAKETCFDLHPIGWGDKVVSYQLAEGGNGCAFFIDQGCTGMQFVSPNGISAGDLGMAGFGDKTAANMLPAGAVSANGGDTWQTISALSDAIVRKGLEMLNRRVHLVRDVVYVFTI